MFTINSIFAKGFAVCPGKALQIIIAEQDCLLAYMCSEKVMKELVGNKKSGKIFLLRFLPEINRLDNLRLREQCIYAGSQAVFIHEFFCAALKYLASLNIPKEAYNKFREEYANLKKELQPRLALFTICNNIFAHHVYERRSIFIAAYELRICKDTVQDIMDDIVAKEIIRRALRIESRTSLAFWKKATTILNKNVFRKYGWRYQQFESSSNDIVRIIFYQNRLFKLLGTNCACELESFS